MWVEGSTLTVLATGIGKAAITVTAEDSDGDQVSDEFLVYGEAGLVEWPQERFRAIAASARAS